MNKTTFARKLRKNSTIEEKRLWNLLKNRQFHNLKFRRQAPIDKYIVDFLCDEIKLVVEIDGSQHNEEENIIRDEERTNKLNFLGYKVIRFWNNEIYNNIEGVISEIERNVSVLTNSY